MKAKLITRLVLDHYYSCLNPGEYLNLIRSCARRNDPHWSGIKGYAEALKEIEKHGLAKLFSGLGDPVRHVTVWAKAA